MKWIKNLAVFSLLVFASFFSTAEAKTLQPSFEKATKKSNSIEDVDHIKVAAFTKSQRSADLSSENRDHSPLFTKWFASYIEFQYSYFHALSQSTSFIRQDINRCFSVSLLIFPFHLFW